MRSLALMPLLLASAQQASDPGATDPRALVQGLIERSTGLEGFRARYSMSRGEEVEVDFELLYAAPDHMRLTIHRSGDGDDEQVRTWVNGLKLSLRAVGAEGATATGDIDFAVLPEPAGSVLRTLDERFPLPETALGPGAVAALTWDVNPEDDKAEFNLQLSCQRDGRRTALGWLEHLDYLGRTEGSWSVEDEHLVWRHPQDRIVARVSRQSGFLERLELIGLDGERRDVDLVELDLAPELEPGLFEVPIAPPGARRLPLDPMQFLGGLAGVRRTAYARVNGALVKGRRAWDESLREDWERVVAALHTLPFEQRHSDMKGVVEARADVLAKGLRERLEQAPPGDQAVLTELRGIAREWHDELVRSIDGELPRYMEALTAPLGGPEASEHLQQLLQLEREGASGLYDEIVRQPLLAILDGRVREVLGD
jgi:hypothetical protein